MINFSISNNQIKKSLSLLGIAGIGVAVALPVLAQAYYPPMVFFQPIANPNYPYRSEKGNLADSLENNDNFKNLAKEIELAGLAETLKKENQTLTLIAPSDEAFEALPQEVFNKYNQPKNRLKVLQYHLIPKEVTEEDLQRGEVTTLAGETIAISSANNTLALNGIQPKLLPTVASNGVAIEIDRVLLPPGF